MPHVIAEVRQNAAANAVAVADNHHVIDTDDDYGDRIASARAMCVYIYIYVCK